MVCLSVKGQDKTTNVTPYDVYCVYYGQLQMSGKVKPKKLIWGDSKSEVKLTNEKGKGLDFNNMIDVTNYLSKRGWAYVESEVFRDAVYVVYKKSVTKDEEAKEGLYFDSDFK
jgi:hypothetical protein